MLKLKKLMFLATAIALVSACNSSSSGDSNSNGEDGDNGGSGGSSDGPLTAFDTPFFFVANDGESGVTGASQLWRTNGLTEGTFKLADPASGGDPDIQELTPFEDGLYFIADDGAGSQIWFSDGTEGGAEKVTNLDKALDTAYLTVMGDYLYFSATHNAAKEALWRTDGTDVELVKDTNAGLMEASTSFLTVMNDTLYFVADDGSGRELWRSDGTEAGTSRVKEINPGGSAFSALSTRRLEVVDDHLFFVASDGDETGLWRSDGTEAGTERVSDVAGAAAMTAVDGTLMFKHNAGSGIGIYVTDGTDAGTTFGLADGTQVFGDDVEPMAHLNGSVFFRARDAASEFGNEPWVSDGTSSGSGILKDINAGSSHSNPENFVRVGDHVYFTASSAGFSSRIWRTDGTEAGTVAVSDGGIGAAGTLIAADGGADLLVYGNLKLSRLRAGELEPIADICPVFSGGCSEYISH